MEPGLTRSTTGRTVLRLLTGLLCAALLTVPVVASLTSQNAIRTAALLDPDATPTGDQLTDSPTPDPTIVDSPTPLDSPTPVRIAPPDTPIDVPTTAGPPAQTSHQLGVRADATNAILTSTYWSGGDTSSFQVTFRNTGTATERVDLGYTLPAGVVDGGANACHGACMIPALAPGDTTSVKVNIKVAANAWRGAPLSGQVTFRASAAGSQPVSGQTNWSVIFPPGPPTPGISLQVANVTLNSQPSQPGPLSIKLVNTGAAPANGTIQIVVPAGLGKITLPSACVTQRQVDPITEECGLGTVPAGGNRTLTIPLLVPDSARADAPLAGLVRATLRPAGQDAASTQASYQILAPDGQTGVVAGASVRPDAAASDAAAAQLRTTSHIVPYQPVIGGSAVILLLVLASIVVVLRRRPIGVPTSGPAASGSAASGPTASGPTASGSGPARVQPTRSATAGSLATGAPYRRSAEPTLGERLARLRAEEEARSRGTAGRADSADDLFRAPSGPVQLEWSDTPGESRPPTS